MSGSSLSLILLPTLHCNVACDYCFEDKTRDSLTLEQLGEIVEKILDHAVRAGVGRLMIHWQGGEIMTLSPDWMERAGELIDAKAAVRGVCVEHGLQSNMVGYTHRWNRVIARMFGNSVGTSMDFPNLHRRLLRRGPDQYTRVWERNVREAREAGIDVSVIAVPNRGTLEVGAARFYDYYVEQLGIVDFQVNTPFPGGEPNEVKRSMRLDLDALTDFYLSLFGVWMERGYDRGVRLGPVDALVDYFAGRDACLPCIWQPNCADGFVSVDARGNTAQCDCWVTSYPEQTFGNLFANESFTAMLESSRAREAFVDRPAVVAAQGCVGCEYLALCHGGCPVRTFTLRGTLYEKDPYCELYKALFARAREVATSLARSRAARRPERLVRIAPLRRAPAENGTDGRQPR